jgi:acetyl esterase/lipase
MMTDVHALLLAGPAPAADLRLIEEIATAEFAALAVAGRVVATADAPALRAALDVVGLDDTCAVVVLSGADAAAGRLLTKPGSRAVWFDPALTGPIDMTERAEYLYGRGLWGLVWAIRRAVHQLRFPARRVYYGPHADQWGELRLPPAVAPAAAVPVAVLLHGGFWRSIWGADLMDALAIDLVGRGFAAWNLEYRRPDLYGWDATTHDVAAGLATLHDKAALSDTADARLDSDRVAVIGHSAGGQLALRLAADGGRMAVAVSLAGVVDLAEGDRRGVGNGAIAAALGGSVAKRPERYAAADPMARLPIGLPLLVVQGRQDDLDLIDSNRRFVRAAWAAGDEVVHLEQPGDHFAVIDPASDIWYATMAEITTRLTVPC